MPEYNFELHVKNTVCEAHSYKIDAPTPEGVTRELYFIDKSCNIPIAILEK